MVTITLHGKAGELFGKFWELDVKSTSEALQAIFINTKGKFREYLINEGLQKKYEVIVDNKHIIKDFIDDPVKKEIHIIPVLEGSDEVLQTIIGAVLIVVGAYTGQGWIAQIGVAMVLGGVAQMLTPTPKTKENRQSSTFSTIDRVVRQGMPVPIAYGSVIIEPLPISVSLTHERV